VVSVAPEAVAGSVAASKAEAVRLSPAEVIATISSPAVAVLNPAVVTVPEATARVLAEPVSKGVDEPPEYAMMRPWATSPAVRLKVRVGAPAPRTRHIINPLAIPLVASVSPEDCWVATRFQSPGTVKAALER
jgi:hypothetical protein